MSVFSALKVHHARSTQKTGNQRTAREAPVLVEHNASHQNVSPRLQFLIILFPSVGFSWNKSTGLCLSMLVPISFVVSLVNLSIYHFVLPFCFMLHFQSNVEWQLKGTEQARPSRKREDLGNSIFAMKNIQPTAKANDAKRSQKPFSALSTSLFSLLYIGKQFCLSYFFVHSLSSSTRTHITVK